MHPLSDKVNSIPKEVKARINQRLEQFSEFPKKLDNEWFQELCFCILAANSKQKTAENIEKSLKERLLTISQEDLAEFIRNNKHRFHNNKAKYIVEARNFHPIKEKLSGTEIEKRQWLIKNIKGLGYKEASHFLRNTGSQDLAILDRHIISILSEYKLIERPESLTPRLYLEIESRFQNLAKELNMSSAKLDLTLWYLKTGEVAK